jgi:hypothetical protein
MKSAFRITPRPVDGTAQLLAAAATQEPTRRHPDMLGRMATEPQNNRTRRRQRKAKALASQPLTPSLYEGRK